MSDPIPLAAPDGTVYAYACGTCHSVHVTYARFATIDQRVASSRRRAARCCVCVCGKPADPLRLSSPCIACASALRADEMARAEVRRVALAERGMMDCLSCYGRVYDGHGRRCDDCDGSGEVPL